VRGNLVAWIKLRRALLKFGVTFRQRIEFFCGLCLLRLGAGVAIVLHDAIIGGRLPPALLVLTIAELVNVTVIFVVMIRTGLKTHRLMVSRGTMGAVATHTP
jgi:hypothetical protein